MARVTSPETPGKSAKPEPTRGVKIFAGILVGLVGLCCVGGAVYAVSSGSKSGSGAATEDDRLFGAKDACESFVKGELKSPATAKFSSESSAKVSATEYTAGGSVDSQNSFGALLRSTFACDMTYDASKQEWTSKSVSVVPA